MTLRHVVLRNPRLHGWQYGMLRAMEDEIIEQTGAIVFEVPDYGLQSVLSRTGHQMRMETARNFLPKRKLIIEADVIWYILMGAENYELDLFKDWNIHAKYRIAYLFDTMEVQFDLTKRLFSNDLFNIRITSFHEAVSHLESITGKKWHAIEQAVPRSLFNNVPDDKKVIDFSSYGRCYPAFHEVVQEFCDSNGLYYDYTTHDGLHPAAPADKLYKQYAWHLSHSKFTISWPVEMTHPAKVGRLKPITCRWFEAGSAGTIIIGKQPGNPVFKELLHPDLVVTIDPFEKKQLIWKNLEKIYTDKDALSSRANKIAEENKDRWLWTNRIRRILDLLDQKFKLIFGPKSLSTITNNFHLNITYGY